jgi:hypothetical protein
MNMKSILREESRDEDWDADYLFSLVWREDAGSGNPST